MERGGELIRVRRGVKSSMGSSVEEGGELSRGRRGSSVKEGGFKLYLNQLGLGLKNSIQFDKRNKHYNALIFHIFVLIEGL